MKKGERKINTLNNINGDHNELMEFAEGSNKMPDADTGLDRYMQKEIEENIPSVSSPTMSPKEKRLRLLGQSKTALNINRVPAKYTFEFTQ